MKKIFLLAVLAFNMLNLFAAQFVVTVDGLVYQQNRLDTTTVSLHYNRGGANWQSLNNYSETSITVPESIEFNGKTYIVNAIGDNALNNCHNLTEVFLPKTIKKIGTYAFSCCNNLKELVLPDSLETIASWAFFNCSLNKLVVPPTLKEIYGFAFYSEISSGGVSNVYISDLNAWLKINFSDQDCNPTRGHFFLNNEPINNLVIPDEIDSINDYALMYVDCESIVIPNHVNSIGKYAFYGSTSKSVKVGDGVREIGSYAFSYCSNITYFELGAKVETICTPAFNYRFSQKICPIKTFICKAKTPPSFTGSNDAFIYDHSDDYEECNLDNVNLIIPENSQRAYRQADTWERFGHIIEDNESINGDVDKDGKINISDVTTLIDYLLRH